MRRNVILSVWLALLCIQSSFGNIYYVTVNGSDADGNGSASNPWRTIKYAVTKVPANGGHTIRISSGTFIEDGQIAIPPGVNLEGAGKDLTIIRATNGFYYNPTNPEYATEKFLFSLTALVESDGNQTLKNFTIDGDSKQLHGGIYVRHRNGVVIEGVRVQNTHFNGIWLWDVKDSKVLDSELLNCSWGSAAYCAGALQLGNIETVEIANVDINESVGYGIKAIGPSAENRIVNLKIRNARVSVNPEGLWNKGSAPNIAIELFVDHLSQSEIYDSYVDNTISVVTRNTAPPSGIQTIRIHHNTIDMASRASGAGYGVELTMHDVEIDHNYFLKGSYAIANWHTRMHNWSIHHNVFYALEGVYPGDIIRSQVNGIANVNFYNNTVEFTGNKTMNVIGLYAGASENVNVINNLFINNNTDYSYYPNELIHLENNAQINGLVVRNNFFYNLPFGAVAGTYSNNLEGDPKIYKSGERPDPFYRPTPESPLRSAGMSASMSLTGLNHDIGALDYDESLFNEAPDVSIGSPQTDSRFYEGSPVMITINASDNTGTVTKVELFSEATGLGTDVSAPFSFQLETLQKGEHTITAVATDSYGAKRTSSAVNITIVPTVKLHLYARDAKLSGHTVLHNDSTASSGSYFLIPEGNGTNYTLGASAAQFDFALEETDKYFLWVRVRAPSADNQAYYLYDGRGNWTTWMAGIHSDWTWVKVTDAYTHSVATFPFAQGANLLVFSWLHENVHVDQALITNNPEYIPPTKSTSTLARTAIATRNASIEPEQQPKKKNISLYPTPIRGDFTISYESPIAQNACIKIMTPASGLVKKVDVILTAGKNTINVKTDHLSSGIYFVSLVTSTGETFEIKTAIAK